MTDKKPQTSLTEAGLMETLRVRFGENPKRHEGLAWTDVEKRLRAKPDKIAPLLWMEQTGGEPDVIGPGVFDTVSAPGEILFCDFAPESPALRRSLCYDQAALDARKEAKPAGSAVGQALAAGAELLDEAQYRSLQALGPFDRKTSSWLLTPVDVRSLGGALFGDWRYGRAFTYHNGAESYYSSRGFRVLLRV